MTICGLTELAIAACGFQDPQVKTLKENSCKLSADSE